jgi:dsRNA-specific ribonuclease
VRDSSTGERIEGFFFNSSKKPVLFLRANSSLILTEEMSNPGVSNCYVFKSRLQEYAQKVGLPTPVYETIKEGPSHQPSFRSTVVVDNLRYDSLVGFLNRKAAEQSAAEVALTELANTGQLNDCVSQPVQETGVCKNLLQEYAQKMNYAIPLYVCERDESKGRVPIFSCTVDVGGMKYIGAAANTKKEAEIKAARTALLAIQSSPGSNETSTEKPVYTVIPSKKGGTDTRISTLENLKPKKGLFKKKPHRKRRDGKKGNSMAMVHLGLGVDIGGHEGQQMDQTANSELSSVEATMNPEGGPKYELSSMEATMNPEGVDIGGHEGQQMDQTANSELPSVEATMNPEGGPKSELLSMEATMNPEGGPIYKGDEVEKSATEESDTVPCKNADSMDEKLLDISVEATMKPEGGPIYDANEVEKFATEESDTVACNIVDPEDGKLQDLGFGQCVLKNPNGGDSTSEVSEVKQNSGNRGGGFDGKQLFFHVSMCQGEEPRVVDGLTPTACGGGAGSKQE